METIRPLESVPTDVLEDFIKGADRFGIRELDHGRLYSPRTNCFCAVGVIAVHRLIEGDVLPAPKEALWDTLYPYDNDEEEDCDFAYNVVGGEAVVSSIYRFNDRAAVNLLPENAKERKLRYVTVRAEIESELATRKSEQGEWR